MYNNILLAITFIILSLHASYAAHMNTSLTASFSIGLGITTFDVIKQMVLTSMTQSNKPTSPLLFNFTDPQNTLSKWIEVSDTVRVEGRSKATLVPHIGYVGFYSNLIKSENIFRIIDQQSSFIYLIHNQLVLVLLVSTTY